MEHHGLYEYSHCSAPEVLLGYIAARTSRLLLGHAVTLTPYRYNHPIRVAERIATLDILSGGRVRWGSGKSTTLIEQTAFEVTQRARRPVARGPRYDSAHVAVGHIRVERAILPHSAGPRSF